MNDIEAVLEFWFAAGMSERWFGKDPEFDGAVRQRLKPAYEHAAAGSLEHWKTTGRGCLALCILLDQVPRNVFRGDPRSFATDGQARDVARHAVSKRWDRDLSQIERLFLYLPFEHSEDLSDQTLGVDLIRLLDEDPTWVDYAIRHRHVIARFGRFPHRNDVMGRESTQEEREYLKGPDAGF